ncbi:MAG: HD domain-containing protein [Clostridia bacterium]|nr:HD domain-containing protein [Clostridia bacterium]
MNFKTLDNGSCECFCVIKSVEVKKSSRGGEYLDLVLCDNSGEIVAKFWDYNDILHGEYAANELIKVRGKVSPYNGVDQLRVEQIRHTVPADNVKIEDFVPSAAYDTKAMLAELERLVNAFEDEGLKAITLALLNKNRDRLLYWPAAFKLHHAMRGGLLTHILSIVRLAQKFCEIYPCLDQDLLLAGAILHDIAKLEEYEVPETGIATGYTAKGSLLGHPVMGAQAVRETARELGVSEETSILLEHMILSHHGVPEFGAAVMPLFPEAEVLSELDLIDARIFEYYDSLEDVPANSFSGKVWALDNRKLYNHGRSKGEYLPKLF